MTAALSMAGFMVACSESQRSLEPRQATGGAPSPGVEEEVGQAFEQLEGAIPGFGGMFRDLDGSVVVWSKAGRLDEPAEREVRGFLGAPSRFPITLASRNAIRVRQGRFAFSELTRWRNALLALPELTEVNFADVDERLNQVVLAVASPEAKQIAERLGRDLRIPEGAMDVIVTEPVHLAQAPTYPPSGWPLNGQLSTGGWSAYPGVQIGVVDGFNNPIALCTATRFLRDNVDEAWVYSTEYLLTAAHCTGRIAFVNSGVKAYQPAYSGSATLLGNLVINPDWIRGSEPLCPATSYCRYSDAAAFRRDAPDKGEHFHIITAFPPLGGPPVSNGGVRMTYCCTPFPLVGDPVRKTGSATGTTTDVVSRTDITVTIAGAGPPGSGFNASFLHQNEAYSASTPTSGYGGDSGAPVWREFGGNVIWHGLLIGYGARNGHGAYYYSLSNYIRSELWTQDPYLVLGIQ